MLLFFGAEAVLMKLRTHSDGLNAYWGGVMIGFFVSKSFSFDNVTPFYIFVAFGAGSLIFIASFDKYAIIALTSCIGSYIITHGIAIIKGYVPTYVDKQSFLNLKEPWQLYAFLGSILTLIILSTIV